jgi:hypothetical protein
VEAELALPELTLNEARPGDPDLSTHTPPLSTFWVTTMVWVPIDELGTVIVVENHPLEPG